MDKQKPIDVQLMEITEEAQKYITQLHDELESLQEKNDELKLAFKKEEDLRLKLLKEYNELMDENDKLHRQIRNIRKVHTNKDEVLKQDIIDYINSL